MFFYVFNVFTNIRFVCRRLQSIALDQRHAAAYNALGVVEEKAGNPAKAVSLGLRAPPGSASAPPAAAA